MLKQLKEKIQEKTKLEKKIQELEKEIARVQRECSILSLNFEEESSNLQKLERKLFLINKENKVAEVQEILRKTKSKLKANQYQLGLHKIELERLNKQYDEVKDSERFYEEELHRQILELNHEKSHEYQQIILDNQNYEIITSKAMEVMECLKKIDHFYVRDGNYTPNEKMYTLGNTTWILGNPYVDLPNLKKEIHIFHEPLKYLDTKEQFKEDLEKYYEYSKYFFNYDIDYLAHLARTSDYPIHIINYKRDIGILTQKILNVYQQSKNKEKELKKQFEDRLLTR